MAKPSPELPVRVFEVYSELREDPALNKRQIAEMLREEFGCFDGYKVNSIIDLVRRQAAERGIDVPDGVPGGRRKNIPEPETYWLDETPELVIPYSPAVIVLSDVHAGQHWPGAIERAIEVIDKRKIKTVVWNGDLFDNAYIGHSGRRSKYAQSQKDQQEAVAGIVGAVHACESLKHAVFLCGNHDDKPFRDTDRELEFDAHLKAALDGVQMPEQVDVTNRYYAVMEPKDPQPWPFKGAENFPWIFTHQAEYGRNQLSVAKRLVDAELGNTCTGHQHHLAVGHHPNGLLYLVDAGTLQDPRLPSYKNSRQTTHPKWAPGFVTITHGVPEVWSMKDAEEFWDARLR